MKPGDKNKRIIAGSYKISLEKHFEENRKRLLEHYRRLQNQQKHTEQRDQEVTSFVCDWQQS